MKKAGLKGVSVVLIALSLFVVAMVAQVRAEEEYHVTAIIQSPEPYAGAEFGFMVTFNDGVLVVSDRFAIIEGFGVTGRAYVCDLEGNIMVTLQSPEPEDVASFGYSMDVSGDIIVIGQKKGETGLPMDVYLFKPDGSLLATLQEPTPEEQITFGYAVAVDGNIIVVTDPYVKVEGQVYAGRAYIFDSEGSLLATLQSPTPGYYCFFGRAATVGEDIIVIGEVLGSTTQDVGPSSAYIFDHEGNLIATLRPPEGESAISFGRTVDVCGDIVVVGDSYAEVDGITKAGRVYLYDSDGNFLRTLQAPEPEEAAHFGRWVDISVDKIAIGEYRADVEAINEGRAHLFDTDGNHLATLQAPEPEVGAYFGWAVAVYGDTVVVAERRGEVEGMSQAGKVYIFSPGAEAESEAEAEQEPEPEQEQTEEPDRGIPGFPYEAIILGLIAGVVILWLLQRRR